MLTSFPCPSCGHAIEIGDEHAGGSVTCPHCRAICAAPPGDTQEDGWITARAPRHAQAPFTPKPARDHADADDLDDNPYAITEQAAPDAAADTFDIEEDVATTGSAGDPDADAIDIRTVDPVKREWEPIATFRTRLQLFIAYVVVLLLFGLVMYFREESTPLELLLSGLFFSTLAVYVLGTFDRVNLSRDYFGKVVLSKTWRFCFIPLKTNKVPLRNIETVMTSVNAERVLFDYIMLIWLLSLCVLPGLLWWLLVFSKPTFQVALAREHGNPVVILYQGTDLERTNDIAKAVSEVCRYRWRRMY